jgi:hypothetical protein
MPTTKSFLEGFTITIIHWIEFGSLALLVGVGLLVGILSSHFLSVLDNNKLIKLSFWRQDSMNLTEVGIMRILLNELREYWVPYLSCSVYHSLSY